VAKKPTPLRKRSKRHARLLRRARLLMGRLREVLDALDQEASNDGASPRRRPRAVPPQGASTIPVDETAVAFAEREMVAAGWLPKKGGG
jgi:hypothetical protein